MDQIILNSDEKMKKTIDATKKTFASVRTGRATPQLLDHIMVDYYGAPVPLKQLATIGAPEPRTLVIQPFDKNSAKEIEKAIQKSDLGLTPNTDSGGFIRLNLPQPTQERRLELVKHVKKEAENSKVAIRNIRKDAIVDIKTKAESEKWSEDKKKNDEADVQKITDKHIMEIDKLLSVKETEIMSI